MRTLTLTAAGLAASALLAFTAQAATISMVADKSTYLPGETITITVTGDSQGGSDNAIFGSIQHTPGAVTATGGTQTMHTSFGGFIPWVTGPLQTNFPNPNTQDVFNQFPGINPLTVDQLQIATATFTAGGTQQVVNFFWSQLAGKQFDFFGLTTGTGTSVTIVPEPTTAALLGIGLLGLAVAGRRR